MALGLFNTLALLCLGAGLLLVSCVTKEKNPAALLPVYLTNRAKYMLLPPGDIESPLDMVQQISARYAGQDYLFSVWVKADETGTAMAIFNSFGTGMGELSYREGMVSFSSPFFPPSLKPEYIMADFQLCFYGVEAVSRALKGCGLSLESEKDGVGGWEIRRINDGKKLIIEIEKTKTAIRYVNHLREYAYTLEGEF
jgi:hypothetical protein